MTDRHGHHPATQWNSGTAEWIQDGIAHLSVVFTWDLPEAYQRAAWYRAQGYRVRAGGPAVMLMPDYLAAVAEIGGDVDALPHHNPHATFTSTGCIRSCPFCAVPRIEGDLLELQHWQPRPIVCDNNLLACSRPHFDRVIDRLKPIPRLDFNQGLDARLLTKYHAQRLAELDIHMARLAWDNIRHETQVHDAIQTLRHAGITNKHIRVYVLIGYNDTPDDALYRLHALRSWGIDTNPMRYQPLDTLRRNSYVHPNWTQRNLSNVARYWSRTRWLGGIPFEEYNRPPAQKPWLLRDPA